MKRLHVHVSVDNLSDAIGFYAALFAAQPTVTKPDYAKWMLDDPRVNFAISTRGRTPGLDHLGIQVEDQGELREVYGRLQQAGRPASDAAVARGRAWLVAHQDRTSGGWTASSVNKRRDPASDTGKFMSDAATAYAVLALSRP